MDMEIFRKINLLIQLQQADPRVQALDFGIKLVPYGLDFGVQFIPYGLDFGVQVVPHSPDLKAQLGVLPVQATSG